MSTVNAELLAETWPGAGSVLFITRYDMVRAALGEPLLTIHKPLVGNNDRSVSSAAGQRSRRIAPLSAVLSEHLAARQIETLATEVEKLTAAFVEELQRKGRLEAIDALASPLPLAIMARLLGLPDAPAGMLRPLFDRITGGHDFGATDTERQQGRMALQMLIGWLDRAIDHARVTSPLMAAIQSTAMAHKLERTAVLYWCAMLLYAGSTTTRDFIGNALVALLEQPEFTAHLQREPAWIDIAIEEMLRMEGPVRGLMREAAADLVIGDASVQKGQLVCLMLSQANRDPSRFHEPDCWNLQRSPNPHLALGANLTYCLGSHLARMEMRGVITGLLPVLSHLRLEGDAPWSTSRLLRGRTRVDITWRG